VFDPYTAGVAWQLTTPRGGSTTVTNRRAAGWARGLRRALRADNTVAGTARARWAVTAVFAANGVTIASFAVRTPSLKVEHGLTTGQLGMVSALFGVAALIVMQLTGRLAARLGSSWIVRSVTVALPIALLALGLADGLAQLSAAMLLIGALNGLLDVTMNAHAVAVERALGRPIMNGCHAAWSIGAVGGSLTGGAAAQAGLSLARHYLWLGVVLVAVALLVGRWLLPASADRRPAPARAGGARRARWTRRLLVLGAMGTTVLTCEAAVGSWSGVLLHENLGASLGVASLGYIAFTACETSGRLVGDRLYARHPARVLVRLSTVIAAGGLAAVVTSPWPALTIAGFAVMGLGLATPLPVLFSVVGHLGADGAGAAALVARFSTMTYSGILLGPAIIGWLAQGIGLTWTLAALIPLLATVAYSAAAVGSE
jgi:predicted MFS family arabinose efflux permease